MSVLLKGKTYEQLIELESTIKKKIQEESGIDIGYWESLLAQLKAFMARARLRDRHKNVLYDKLNSLKKEQGIKDGKSQKHRGDERPREREETRGEKEKDTFERKLEERIRKEEENFRNKALSKKDDEMTVVKDEDEFEDDEEMDEFDRKEREEEENEVDMIDQNTAGISEYENGNYTPVLFQQEDLPFDIYIMTKEEDLKKLLLKRNQLLGHGKKKPDREEIFAMKARESIGGLDEGEVESSSDQNIKQPLNPDGKSNTIEITLDLHYNWSDKYRPRKPRYYNRVHTGYDWNQYNKKHYDVDNPPPKTVQGYKFNIFYPDMIDKTKTPQYTLVSLRFSFEEIDLLVRLFNALKLNYRAVNA